MNNFLLTVWASSGITYPSMSELATTENITEMSLDQLAAIIKLDWIKVNYAAKPYLDAMASLDSINDNYGMDSGRSVVAYFLCNASTWRGDTARAIKTELKRRNR